jgi:hypothetical protein
MSTRDTSNEKIKLVEKVKQTLDSKIATVGDLLVPVCQKILVKRIVPIFVGAGDTQTEVRLQATVIQRVLGYHDPVMSLNYRVNGTILGVDAIKLRRSVKLVDKDLVEGEQELGTSFTIDLGVPLKLVNEFYYFPFLILRASVQLELESPASSNGIILRPNLWNFDEKSGGSPTDVLQLKDEGTKLNGLPLLAFVNVNPIRECPQEKKSDGTVYYPMTELTWYLKDLGFKRMLSSLAPLYLVLLLAVVNWTTFLQNHDDRGEHVMTSVGIALTAVILLPNILSSLQIESAFDLNFVVFLLWLVGLGLSSIPYRAPAMVGIGFLALAGMSPLPLFCFYQQKLKALRNESSKPCFKKAREGKEKPRVIIEEPYSMYRRLIAVFLTCLFGAITRAVK